MDKNKTVIIGPTLPPSVMNDSKSMGCAEDKGENQKKMRNNSPVQNVEDGIFGPALPPGFKMSQPENNVVIGPALPPEFTRQEERSNVDEDDDGVVIGPLPPSASDLSRNQARIAAQFEKRSKDMKDKLTGNEAPKKLEREEWMTELPPILKEFGMGPRQFRKNAAVVGDRSVWTDTPEEKVRKSQNRSKPVDKVEVTKPYQSRDDEIEKKITAMKGTEQPGSLLSMHQKERKRKIKEEKEAGNVRRPFDRDLDLQVNRFDDAVKKRLIKQSRDLTTRFSHGETSAKFL